MINKNNKILNTIKEREYSKEIGKKIRIARISAGMTQVNLAKKLNLGVCQLYNYETGKGKITVAKLYCIADILNINILTLLPKQND